MKKLALIISSILVFSLPVSALEDSFPERIFDGGIGQTILISLGIGFVISLIVVMVKKSGMKTVRSVRNAENYLLRETLNITHSSDRYLYTTVTRTKKNNNSSKR